MALDLGELAVILTADDSRFNKKVDKVDARLRATAKLALFTGAAGAAINLAAALAPIAGGLATLPTAAFGAIAAIGALKLALHGLKDVFGSALTADMDGFTKGLDALPPAVAGAVREIGGSFIGLQKSVQSAFFAPVAKASTGLAAVLHGPLVDGMSGVGAALGRVTGTVVSFIKQARTIEFLKSMFAGTADGIDELSYGVDVLLAGIRDIAALFVPSMKDAGSSVSSVLARVGLWLSEIANGGDAWRWVSAAKDALGQLSTIGHNVARAVKAIFSAAGADAGQGLLQTVADLTDRFARWAASAEGQRQLAQVIGLVTQVTTQLMAILPGVATVIGQIAIWIAGLPPGVQGVVSGFLAWSVVGGLLVGKLQGVVSGIGSVIGGISKVTTAIKTPDSALRNFFSRIGDGMKSAGEGIASGAKAAGGWFGDMATKGKTAAKDLGTSIATTAKDWGTSAAKMGTSVATFAKKVGSSIAEVIKAQGAMIATNAKSAATFIATNAKSALQFMISTAKIVGGWILMGIQSMINALIMAAAWIVANWPLVLVIAGIIAFVALIVLFWDQIKEWTIGTFTAIWGFIKGAFDKVLEIINFCIDWVKENWPLLLAILTGPFGLAVYFIIKFKDDIINFAKMAVDWVVQKFGELVSFVTSLPGKIASAARGLWDGIVSAFKSAINVLIGLWNNFQITLGGGSLLGLDIPKITLSTPDIPFLAKGGVSRIPGTALVGERGPELLHMPRGAVVEPLSHARERLRESDRDDRREQRSIVIENVNVHALGRPNPVDEVLDHLARTGVG